MIGRCANIIYQDMPDVTTVYLHADMEHRVHRIMERDHVSDKEARKQIRETDKKESSSINPAPIPPGVIRTSISCLLIPVLWASNNLLS